jgi:Flp pilus assembly protein TadB
VARSDLRADHGPMKSHRPRTWLLYVVGLVVVVMTGLWVINVLLGLLFKVFLAAIVVAAAVYLVGRSTRRLDDKGPRSLGR